MQFYDNYCFPVGYGQVRWKKETLKNFVLFAVNVFELEYNFSIYVIVFLFGSEIVIRSSDN